MLGMLRAFMSVFGDGYGGPMVFVGLGSIITALFETLGILLIFPLMHLVLNPKASVAKGALGRLYQFVGEPSFPVFIGMVSAGIGGVYLAKSLFQIGFSRWEFNFLSRWKNSICTRFFERFLDASYEYHTSRESSLLISIVSRNISLAVNNFIHQYIVLISQIVTALFIFSFILYYNAIMTISVGIFVFVLFKGQSALMRKKLENLGHQSMELDAKNIFVLQQGIGAYKETKINLKEKFFRRMFEETNRKLVGAEGDFLFIKNLPLFTNELIILMITIVAFNIIVAVGGSADAITTDLAVTVMTLFRFIPIANRSLTAVSFINGSIAPVKQLMGEAVAIHYGDVSALDEDAVSIGDGGGVESLALDGVCYTYSGAARPTLVDVNLAIGKGEFVGMIGPSGSGKTTVLAILLGFISPNRGKYLIDGVPADPGRIRALRRLIGYVDQQPFIFGGSVMENVAFGVEKAEIDRALVETALRQAELWDFVSDLPRGMDAPVGENGKLFSGGQRQRLAIARALYKQPQVLILDEATSALDIGTEHRLSQTIQKLKGHLTVIAVAHRLSTLAACDRLVMMKEGRIVDTGPYGALLERNESFRKMVQRSHSRSNDGVVDDEEAGQPAGLI